MTLGFDSTYAPLKQTFTTLFNSQICTKFENVTRLVLRQRIASLYKIEKKKKNRRTTLIEDGTREMARKNELPRINIYSR